MLKHCILLTLLPFAPEAADPLVGTWKLDPAKSHFENTEAPKSLVVVIKEQGANYALDFNMVMQDGRPEHFAIQQPKKGGVVSGMMTDPGIDAGTVAVIDPKHMIYTYTKGGKFVAKRIVTISPDGKSIEVDMSMKLPNGKMMVDNEYNVKQ